MPAARDIFAATAEAAQEAIRLYKQHYSGQILDTRSVLLDILRDNFPTYHVTEVDQSTASLLEFASAGKATANLDSSSENFAAARQWKPVGERVEKKLHPGKLTDDFRFARFQYIWEGKEYLVYHGAWKELYLGSEHVFYILYPRSSEAENVQDGHCKESDDLILACGKWTSQLHNEIWVFDDGRWVKSKELWNSVHGSSWEDVILDPEMKKNIIDDVQGFFNNQQLYRQFAVPWRRGLILHGVPGNGKTVSIKALMSSLYDRPDSIPALYIKSLSSKCNTEQFAIRRIFSRARASAPCLLIFEDLDSLVTDSIRSYFLNEVDGLESNDGILMIGSTNHLDRLDPAIAKRPSRFDRKYHFKLPGEPERSLYAEYWRQKLLKNGTVEFPADLCGVIAKMTEGFSFAYMKELFVMALLSLARGYKAEDFAVEGGDAVDAAEAVRAAEEKTPAEPETAQKNEEAIETCCCNEKCNKCGKPVGSAEDKATATPAKKEKLKNPKINIDDVEVPAHLQDNVLLKVLEHHIRVLHTEMDNTEQDSWPSGKAKVAG
ncbi:proteasome-activating nucleotidase, partial [Aaosphaeria arxii CBS 175.79]